MHKFGMTSSDTTPRLKCALGLISSVVMPTYKKPSQKN